MNLDGLLLELAGAPSLPGAKCRGRHHLFDPVPEGQREHPDVTAQRHAQALQLCRNCGALASCRVWFDDLPKSRRPVGVVAGQLNPRPVGRPKDETA